MKTLFRRYAINNAIGDAQQPVTVEHVSTERDLVESAGAHYVRVAVPDHAHPLDSAVGDFVIAVRRLPQSAWAHFHCEGGPRPHNHVHGAL